MKTVLIIAYYFPPSPAVGSRRALGLAKYLPEFGWNPVILTVKLPNRQDFGLKLVETEQRESLVRARRILGVDPGQNLLTQVEQLKRKLHVESERSAIDVLVRCVGELVFYPDPQKGWRRVAIRSGDHCLQQMAVDAVVSTSSPVTSHRVASQLKRRHGIPWVADFRDLWTQNHYYPYSRIRRRMERRLELRTLSGADAIVTVAQPLATKLADLHKGKRVTVITNGFDVAEVDDGTAGLTEKFTITYTGNLYPGKQSPEPLFAALRDLISQKSMDSSRVEVRFYCAEAGWIDRLAESYGLKGAVRQYGIVPREVALEKQRESQLLLLLKWNDPEERGAYSAKLFEYLAARRPILALGGYPDVVSDLLQETGAGFDVPGVEEIKSVMTTTYGEYQSRGSVSCRGDDSRIRLYSQTEMARGFGEILNSLERPVRRV